MQIKIDVSTTKERVAELLEGGVQKFEIKGHVIVADGKTDDVLLVDGLDKPLRTFFERIMDPSNTPQPKTRKGRKKKNQPIVIEVVDEIQGTPPPALSEPPVEEKESTKSTKTKSAKSGSNGASKPRGFVDTSEQEPTYETPPLEPPKTKKAVAAPPPSGLDLPGHDALPASTTSVEQDALPTGDFDLGLQDTPPPIPQTSTPSGGFTPPLGDDIDPGDIDLSGISDLELK